MANSSKTPVRVKEAPRAPRARSLGLAITALLLVVALAALFRAPLLRGAAGSLSVEDELRPAEVILMLPGDLEARPRRAAGLHARGLAPVIVIPRPEDRAAQTLASVPNEAELGRRILIALGVPDSAIVLIRGDRPSTSTRDDARIFAAWAAQRGVRSAIVVTSAYHTRRARWALRRALEQDAIRLIIAPATHERFDETNWWKSEEGLLAYVNEYLKFVHNLFGGDRNSTSNGR